MAITRGPAAAMRAASSGRAVDALTTTDRLVEIDITAVLVEAEAIRNTVLDSGSEKQVVIDRIANAFRATPVPGDLC